MIIKEHVTIEFNKEGKVFSFSMPRNASVTEAFLAVHGLLDHIKDLAKKSAEQNQNAQQEAQPEENK